MPVASLVDTCTRVCIKNIRNLNDVGDFEYWKIRPVLQRLESPAQLREIELNSPQICGEDAELWRAFIARDFNGWERKNYAPKNPLRWAEVYIKYKKEQQLEIAKDEEVLRASMGQLKKAKETNVSKVMDLRALPKVPKDPGVISTGKKRIVFQKEAPNSLVWGAGSKTKLTDGKSVLTRARREAMEITQRSKLAKPTHELKGKAGQIRKAPTGMVNEYRRISGPPIKILARKKHAPGVANGFSLEDRERKLLAAQASAGQQGNSLSKDVTLVGSSDDESGDDFLDDKSTTTPSTNASTPTDRLSAYLPHAATSARPIAGSSSLSSRQIPAIKQPTRQHRPSSSSVASNATGPFNSTSSGTSRPRPAPTPMGSSPKFASLGARSPSPVPNHFERRPPPTGVRRKAEVDIFNRGASKKPRR